MKKHYNNKKKNYTEFNDNNNDLQYRLNIGNIIEKKWGRIGTHKIKQMYNFYIYNSLLFLSLILQKEYENKHFV